MSTSSKIVLGIVAITAFGVIISLSRKKRTERQWMRSVISDEGYETAGDILFPSYQFRR